MKRNLFLYALLFVMTLTVKAQGCDMPIAAVLPENIEGLTPPQQDFLMSRLVQLIATDGETSNLEYTQFMLTANVYNIQKENLPTMPITVSCQCEVMLRLVDVYGMKSIATKSILIKGAGSNEAKAMQNALKLIKSQNKQLLEFITSAKNEVLQYYNSHLDEIIAKTKKLAAMDQYEEAFHLLSSVPECCNRYESVTSHILSIYPKAINKVGEKYLREARKAWTVNQTREAAEEACYYLSLIDPKSSAYPAGERLYGEIKDRVKEEVKYDLKKYEDKVDLVKQQINAAKEIGIAYGKGQQPKTAINMIK